MQSQECLTPLRHKNQFLKLKVWKNHRFHQVTLFDMKRHDSGDFFIEG